MSTGPTKPRVIQWATGQTGMFALRNLLDSNDYTLTGVRVYDSAKVGIDAGALCGRADIGLPTTDDRDALIASQADIVLYMGKVETDTPGCLADVCELLASGKDVIATGSRFTHPRSMDAGMAEAIEAACAQGNATFLGLGLFPGFYGEILAPVLSRLTQTTSRISVREVINYATYASADLMFDTMGFAHLPEDKSPALANEEYAAAVWIGTATILAHALGLRIDSVEGYRHVATTPRDLEVAAGRIPAGTVAAMRFGVSVTCGDTRIDVEHLTRMADDIAPDWPSEIGYEICYEGEPNIRVHMVVGAEGEDHSEQGCLATAMHAVNAIPAVLAAGPGLYDLSTIRPFVRRPQSAPRS
ncbi:NAD(P)H-dependent amine dehydrogenase family protein [Mycolicibacterium vinylchloridicum]|uniref:NAD(P)H-dependent amine dehydrogenase family protein n=1 Tax=Mycolicibacterium vinylchloridicum TaxID=2736928 RepID=UPI002D7F24CC|nr:dihydrodipicolinate reductase [Mycolicibacterium vinylchloridicum]